jgi:16S rRNA (adenine1518-N6/adenine1519-N6)-dimethyltransferase
MTLTEMRALLVKRDIQLTKSLGQNFLHDGNQLGRIVAAAELTRTDKVLEIGPGLGPLTELLLEDAGEVFAIEKDRRLVEFLQDRFGLEAGSVANATRFEDEDEDEDEKEHASFCLLHDDALDFLKRETRDWSEWKLVANLPYSVASPILVELAQARGCPQRLVATLQLEVAKRLMSTADDEDYGVLTLLVQLCYEPREWFKIPSECFFPAPEVDSACVVLIRRETPLLPDEQHGAFRKIVKRAFSQRRKIMLKLLKQDWPKARLEHAFKQMQFSPLIRGEALSLAQFVELTRLLST